MRQNIQQIDSLFLVDFFRYLRPIICEKLINTPSTFFFTLRCVIGHSLVFPPDLITFVIYKLVFELAGLRYIGLIGNKVSEISIIFFQLASVM